MTQNLLFYLFGPLVLTWLIEWPIVLFIGKTNWKRACLASLFVNGMTNPLVNSLYRFFAIPVLLLEIGVVLAEMYLFGELLRVGSRRAMVLSIAANAASYFLGTPILLFLFNHG